MRLGAFGATIPLCQQPITMFRKQRMRYPQVRRILLCASSNGSADRYVFSDLRMHFLLFRWDGFYRRLHDRLFTRDEVSARLVFGEVVTTSDKYLTSDE